MSELWPFEVRLLVQSYISVLGESTYAASFNSFVISRVVIVGTEEYVNLKYVILSCSEYSFHDFLVC